MIVQNAVKSDKRTSFRNVDDGLKTQQTKFYKHISSVTNISYTFHLNINVTDTVKTVKETAVSVKHFQSVCSIYSTANRT